ncbi:uncharacterized protein BKA55DRAFT_262568 [Fusarium redolens]|uniref:Uncharacterized protein n=1 Tax=Fusarium redolens TaxID=48865 RepID=A0A9P9FXK2_FUSRE|nr:uncharacterized protein BKA55DRAFT_262568 [Fusarium redolens]KAH7208453.1 hypothetical protein BKA55DRAFT_262568 [Fusarium redolens]
MQQTVSYISLRIALAIHHRHVQPRHQGGPFPPPRPISQPNHRFYTPMSQFLRNHSSDNHFQSSPTSLRSRNTFLSPTSPRPPHPTSDIQQRDTILAVPRLAPDPIGNEAPIRLWWHLPCSR